MSRFQAPADFYDGQSARCHPVVITVTDGTVVVQGAFGERRAALAEVSIGERFGTAPRSLRFADGAHCEPHDNAAFEEVLAAAGWREGAVVRVQRRWSWALGALAGFFAVIGFGYVVLLPWLAGVAAPRLSPALVGLVSDSAMTQLDRSGVLLPSHLTPERQQAIADRLAALPVRGYRLHFRSSPRVGPNAFALPDGQVVLLDELVALAENDDQIVGVLAHEVGHVHHRHATRQMIQGAVVSFAFAAWFGDISSFAAGLGAMVLESRYSREFEREADAWAAQALVGAGASAEPLARMLELLEASHRKSRGPAAGVDWLSSHPDFTERVAALRGRPNR